MDDQSSDGNTELGDDDNRDAIERRRNGLKDGPSSNEGSSNSVTDGDRFGDLPR
jgi:hypothetical protein